MGENRVLVTALWFPHRTFNDATICDHEDTFQKLYQDLVNALKNHKSTKDSIIIPIIPRFKPKFEVKLVNEIRTVLKEVEGLDEEHILDAYDLLNMKETEVPKPKPPLSNQCYDPEDGSYTKLGTLVSKAYSIAD